MTTATQPAPWFLEFFFLLRQKGLKVSLNEWMTLVKALKLGLHDHSLDGFYDIARTVLVKSEAELESFDALFAYYFEGQELPPLPDVTSELLEWLREAVEKREVPPDLLEQLAQQQDKTVEELLRDFERLLEEQDERHDGGNKWIGTGGTSPFGHSGSLNQPGVRVGGKGGGRQAIMKAGQHNYDGYSKDRTLDIRQFQLALKSLRVLANEGVEEELDLDATVNETARNAGELELVFRPNRKNTVKLLLLMDSGGSMDPYASICSMLFSATHQMSHFKDFQYYYFHNCIYQFLYRDKWEQARTPFPEFLHKYDKSYKVILVGDACMAPYELLNNWYGDGVSGLEHLELIRRHFDRCVWLNPEPKRIWNHETIYAIRQVFPMFPLTVNGLNDAVEELTVKR